MNILTMREEPLFKKCCFVLPLRLCLQIWAFLKVTADVLTIQFLFLQVMALLYSHERSKGSFFSTLSFFHLLMIAVLLALIVDVIFLIGLIIGIFKKSFATIQVFYYYEFYAMAAEAVVLTIICVDVITDKPIIGAIFAVIAILYILLHLCILLTVKSEMIKLRNKDQYDFSKIPENVDTEVPSKFKMEEE